MNKPVSTAVATLMFGTLGSVVMAHDASALSLQEALVAAYTSNPQLEAERAYVRSIDEQVPQALSGWRPTVTLNGTAGAQHIDSHSASTIGVDSTLDSLPGTVGVTVSQPVFNGFGTEHAVNAAENTVKAARSTLASTEETVLLAAATAYVNVLKDQALVELNINNQHVLERDLQSTQDQFRVGQLTRTDVSQAEASVAGAVAGVEAARGTLETDKAAFVKAVGLNPDNLVDPGDAPGLPASQSDVVAAAIANEPDVIAADFTAKAATENIGVVKGKLLPQVNLQASYNQDWNQTTKQSDVSTTVVEGVVSVPLYEAGSTWSQMRAAKHQAGQARIQVEQTKQSVQSQAVQNWQSLVSAKAQVASYKAQIEAARVALDGVRREQQVGSRTVLDVLTAEQTLLNAEVSLASALHDEHAASYQILASIGHLTAESLALPVTKYNPETHYNEVRNKLFGSSDSADKDADMAPKASAQ